MLNRSSVIGVVGAGAMGAGIAQVAATQGHGVLVLDQDQTALAGGRESIAKGAAALVKRGKLDAAETTALESRVRWTLAAQDLSVCDLVIEAIVEKEETKVSLFRALEDTLRPEAAIATNTSSLSVTRLGAALARPERFLGLHFFNPAPVMKLVEVVSGAATDAALATAAETLMRQWGKEPVAVRDAPGFIVNRVARPFYAEGWRAHDEGAADAATIDFLFRDLAGFRMGPLELGDLIGHDVNYAVAQSVYDAYYGRTRFAPSLAQGALVDGGRLGRKSGVGVYDYREGAPTPAPTFAERSSRPPTVLRLSRRAEPLKTFLDACSAESAPDPSIPAGFLSVDGVLIGFSIGWPAAAFAHDMGRPVALLDWMRDPKAARAIAFAASNDEARNAALGLAAACDKEAVQVSDRPGMIVLRTLAQIANAAGDAARDRIAEEEGVDRAMRFGANYPFGPLEWARMVSPAIVVEILDAIAEETGEPMYYAGEHLRAMARRAF